MPQRIPEYETVEQACEAFSNDPEGWIRFHVFIFRVNDQFGYWFAHEKRYTELEIQSRFDNARVVQHGERTGDNWAMETWSGN